MPAASMAAAMNVVFREYGGGIAFIVRAVIL
jgi:hypothetical protein